MKKQEQVGRVLMAGIILLLMGIGMLKKVVDIVQYERTISESVSIDAVVSRVEQYEDADGDTQSDVYITYTYQGEEYEVKYEPETDSGYKELIGKTVAVRIDPDHPDVLMENLIKSRFIVYIGVLMVWGGIAVVRVGLTREPVGPPDREVIHLYLCYRSRMGFVIPVGTGMLGIALILLHYLCPMGSEGMLFHVVGMVIVILSGWRLVYPVKLCRMVANREYTLVYSTLQEKVFDAGDSDSSDTYRLRFVNNRGTWWKRVDRVTYHNASVGDPGIAVYLPGKDVPICEFC